VVIATTGWSADRGRVEALLREYGVAAVAASNFSIGVVLFGRLVETAVKLFGPLESFDPYLVEWHRRQKRDRPSGTAVDLGRRIVAAHPRLAAPDDLEVVSVRAGSSPGMHLVGFDAAGETVELRLTARDRSAYAAGILAAADWLTRVPREPGIHAFDPIVDELVARDPIAA
jgi:4-hydroxy-tetrahydrodipicolinate reductase